MIDSGMWEDPFFFDLTKDQRYLWMYILTCPKSNIAGIYEIGKLEQIAFATKLNIFEIEEHLKFFEKEKKAKYSNYWIGIRNFIKHQRQSHTIMKGIQTLLDDSPEDLLIWVFFENERLKRLYPGTSQKLIGNNIFEEEIKDDKPEVKKIHTIIEETEKENHEKIVIEWYKLYHKRTSYLIAPGPEDYDSCYKALQFIDYKTLNKLVPMYFDPKKKQYWNYDKKIKKYNYVFKVFANKKVIQGMISEYLMISDEKEEYDFSGIMDPETIKERQDELINAEKPELTEEDQSEIESTLNKFRENH